MGDFTKLARKVISVARGDEKKKPSPYDTKAVVNRIDYTEKKAYVRFYGGIDETPVDLTINCSRGDTVQVRVGGGRAWLTGNLTAPPTDDKAVTILNHTVNNLRSQMKDSVDKLEEEIEEIEPGEGKVIERIATEYILSLYNYLVDDEVVPYEPEPGEPMDWSEELPDWVPNPRTYYWTRTVIYYTDGTIYIQEPPILDQNSQITAEADYAINTENNYFWHNNTGAWVTEVEKDTYLEDPTQGGYASRVTNAGILQTYNSNLLTSWTGSGITFYDGTASTASDSTKLATFGTGGVSFNSSKSFTLGNTTGQNPSYIRWINTGTDVSPNWKLQICADTIQFGGNDVVTTDDINLYSIDTNVESVVANNDGTASPSSLVIHPYYEENTYSGRIKVYRSETGTTWEEYYVASSDASLFTVDISPSYYRIKTFTSSGSAYSGRIRVDKSLNGSTWTTLYTATSTASSFVVPLGDQSYRYFKVYMFQSNGSTAYTGKITVEESEDQATWISHFESESAANNFEVPLDPVGKYKIFKIDLYEAGGVTNLLSSKTIPLISEGVGVARNNITYAYSTSATTVPSSFPYTSPPSVPQGYYLWTRVIVEYTDGTSTESYSVSRQGQDGAPGTDVTSRYVTFINDTEGVVVRHMSESGTTRSFPYLKCNADGVWAYGTSQDDYTKIVSGGFHVFSGGYERANIGSTIYLYGNSNHSAYTSVNSSGLNVYAPITGGSALFASFTNGGAQIGRTNGNNVYIDNESLSIKYDTNVCGKLKATSSGEVLLTNGGNTANFRLASSGAAYVYSSGSTVENAMVRLAVEQSSTYRYLTFNKNGLYIFDHGVPIGEIVEKASTSNVGVTTSWTQIGTTKITLNKGIWFMEAHMVVESGTPDLSGRMGCQIYNITSSTAFGKGQQKVPAISDGEVTAMAIATVSNSNTEYVVRAFCAGANVKVSGGIKAVCIC